MPSYPVPTPITSTICSQNFFPTDSFLSEALKKLNVFQIFRSLKITRKEGVDSLEQIFLTLMLIPLLKVNNIWCFSGKFLRNYLQGGKDVLYRFLHRQDINWQRIQLNICLKIWQRITPQQVDTDMAFIVDDTLKARRGNKLQASSFHFDHNTGRSIFGQQVLQLAISSKSYFLPILQHFFVGKKKRQEAVAALRDKRNSVSKSYHQAHHKNKNELLREMISKAISAGFEAYYFLADAWFGNKVNIQLCLDKDLIGIMMMKRGKTKFRFEGKDMSLKAIYRSFLKNNFHQYQSFKYRSVIASLNLASYGEPDRYHTIKLVFSQTGKGKKQKWVVLLCTDEALEDKKIFQIYSLRWNIESYFKEAKQYLGFLSEQSSHFVVHYASVHLTALRYSLLVYLCDQHFEGAYAQTRKDLSDHFEMIAFTQITWSWFQNGLCRVLDELGINPDLIQEIKKKTELAVQGILMESLFLCDASYEKFKKQEKQIN